MAPTARVGRLSGVFLTAKDVTDDRNRHRVPTERPAGTRFKERWIADDERASLGG
jgi:hypothetical protein